MSFTFRSPVPLGQVIARNTAPGVPTDPSVPEGVPNVAPMVPLYPNYRNGAPTVAPMYPLYPTYMPRQKFDKTILYPYYV